MRILNLYAGIGGNRKLWGDTHSITAVELNADIAEVYKTFYPNDEVIVADAHQYLIENFQEFDFIWSSPPCPTHSRVSTALKGYGVYRYPDLKLYEEIIFLKHFFKGDFVIENVIPYYQPLIPPSFKIGRHFFWSNKDYIRELDLKRKGDVSRQTKEVLSEQLQIFLPKETKDQRKLLRNCVQPEIGLHILNAFQN